MAVGLALPPYFTQKNDSGMELEIIRAALKIKGHTVNTVFLPFARVSYSMNSKKVDCASPMNESSGVNAFYSNSHIAYQNFAISLKSNNLKITSIGDLKDKSVLAFQNASKYLGKDFAAMSKSNPKYKEKANQITQNKLLFANRTQTIVGDINIFKFFNKKLPDSFNTSQKLVFHPLFPKTHYKVAFVEESVRDDFNEGLKKIKTSGLYDRIIAKYIE